MEEATIRNLSPLYISLRRKQLRGKLDEAKVNVQTSWLMPNQIHGLRNPSPIDIGGDSKYNK